MTTNLADAMPFAKILGVETTEATAERVVGKMIVEPNLCTVGAIAHGGALMTFADCLAAIGAYLSKPDGADGTTTVESKVNFLGRAPVGATLTGTATPLSAGKRISVWQTRIVTEDDALVAQVTQTQLVL